MINYIAIQTVRGHRWREDFNAMATQQMRVHLGETVTDDTIRTWLRKDGQPNNQDDINAFRAEMLGSNRPRLVAPDAVLIQEGLKFALGDLGERLADNMRWTLIVSDKVPVLTSDEPVCWWAPGDGPVGYGSAEVVWLPLSPRVILQLHNGDTSPDALGLPSIATCEGRDELCRLINSEVAGQAHRWIVHHPDDRALEGLEIAPRTAWDDEIVSVEENGTTRREFWIHRRLPVRPS